MNERTMDEIAQGWDADPAASMSLHADAYTNAEWFEREQRVVVLLAAILDQMTRAVADRLSPPAANQ